MLPQGGIQLSVNINGQASGTLRIPAFAGKAKNYASSGKLTYHPISGVSGQEVMAGLG